MPRRYYAHGSNIRGLHMPRPSAHSSWAVVATASAMAVMRRFAVDAPPQPMGRQIWQISAELQLGNETVIPMTLTTPPPTSCHWSHGDDFGS